MQTRTRRGGALRRPLWVCLVTAWLAAACAGGAAPPAPTAAPTAAPKPAAAPTSPPVAAAPTAASAQPAAAAKPTEAAAPKPTAAAPTIAAPVAKPAAAAADFRGKTVRLIVGYAPGGGFDTNARLLAPLLAQALPGNPTVVVENQVGADSLLAAKTVLSAPVRSEEVSVVIFISTLPVKSILSGGLEGFAPEKEGVVLGKPDAAPQQLSFCIHTDKVKSLDEFLALKQPVKMGGLTGGSYFDTIVRWTQEAGYPVEPVFGYPAGQQMVLAFNRGEVDALASCRDFDFAQNPDWLGKGEVTPLFYYYAAADALKKAVSEGKYPWFKHVLDVKPVSPELKAVLQTLNDLNTGTNVYAVSKQVPAPIQETLKAAFKQAVTSEAYRKAMEDRQLVVGYQSPEDIEKSMRDVEASSPAAKELLKRTLGF